MKQNSKVLTIVFLACIALFSCASTGGEQSAPAPVVEKAAPAPVVEEPEGTEGIPLAEAIERSAEKIAADLPAGSRVAIVAWESPSIGFSDYIMEELTGALVDRRLEVADRQNLEYVYRELNFQMSGEVSDESARSIGKFLGADLVITGQLTELGGPYRFRANAIHVENATRDSVSRLDVRGDAAMRRMAAALANQKPAVKTASYGESGSSAPKTAGAFFDRGLLFAGRGEWEIAIADFTEAIALNPNLSAAYILRGRALRASVSQVLSVGENFGSVITSRIATLSPAQRQASDRAIADFSQAIRLDPDSSIAYRERGVMYDSIGDQDKAIADCTQAIRIDPHYAMAYYSRGNAYSTKGDKDKAIADLTQAIKLDPNFASAYSNRGSAYTNKGDYDRAIADLTQAIKLDPNDASAYNSRGLAYNNKGDYDRAIADYTQAIRINPNFANAYSNRGYVYTNKGDYDRAIADLTHAIRIDPNDAYAYTNRGVAYYNKKDYDRAIADYEAALRINPNHTDAKNNLEIARRARGR